MSTKSRGTNAERELVRLFWSNGWAALRVAGSGSSHYPSPDLIVGKNGRKLAIECKLTTDDKKYIPNDEISQLSYFSKVFGAESWIAVRFTSEKWRFFLSEDLPNTGKNVVITKSFAKEKGLSFEELLGNF